MMEVSLPAVGGTAGLILALLYVGRLVLDWWRGRNTDTRETTATAAEVSNALIDQLQESLAAERETNRQLSGRNEELEMLLALAHQRNRDQRREYEREIEAMRAQLLEVSERLEAMQARLRDGR